MLGSDYPIGNTGNAKQFFDQHININVVTVAKKLKLRLSDTLEWSENRSGDIVVKNIGTPVFKKG